MLKKLEVNGFKSFANKTTLEFPGGISAIVGPNGSGKSNVIDALRWLLGERDAKNLRGAKAEDLIFAGTQTKPRMGLAQASIYFDNASSFFPVEFSEIVVARQVSRDGESRYFLNKAEVRLKDIVDFFARVRLGARGLVVVGQGESDMFIKAVPKERREMIEEILGLREYQLKIAEAERKHKNALINLDKVSALVEEIAPHLKMLRRQTARWDKRSIVETELAGLERTYFAVKLAEVRSYFAKLDPEIKQFDVKLATAGKELAALEEAARALEVSEPATHEELRNVRSAQADLGERRLRLQKELGRLEARLEFFITKSKDVAIPADRAIECLKRIKTELEQFHILDLVSIRNNVRTLINEISELFRGDKGAEDEARALEASKKSIVGELEGIEAEIKKHTHAEAAMNKALESQNAEFKKAFAAIQEKKSAVYDLEGEKNKLLFERERWSLREGDIKTQVTQAGHDWQEFLKAIAHESVNVASDLKALPDLEKKMLRLRGELASMGEVDEAIVNEAKEIEERHAFLTTQSEDLKQAIADLEKLRRELEEKITAEFTAAIHKINQEFLRLFELMFGGGKAKLVLVKPERKPKKEKMEEGETGNNTVEEVAENEEEEKQEIGIDIEVSIPRKRITGLDMLSGGERSLVSIAALFALVSVSPPPFLVLDEIDAALDERNARRFAEMLKGFSEKTQFVVVTHNRATMEVANVLYGVTMGEDGTSRVLSLKIEDAPLHAPA